VRARRLRAWLNRASPWTALSFWIASVGLLTSAIVLGIRHGTVGLDEITFQLSPLGFATVGAVIVVRRPGHPIGWLFCVDALLNGIAFFARELVYFTVFVSPGALPGAAWLAWLVNWVADLGWALMLSLTPLLFPTGRPPSRRWGGVAWLLAGLLVFHTLVMAFRPGAFEEWPMLTNPLGLPLPAGVMALDAALDNVVFFLIAACILSLLVRFRSARGDERQQIKWIAFAASLVLAAAGLAALGRWQNELLLILVNLAAASFPVAVGISILRYRLYDLDLIVRRTLSYSVLTGLLALLYFGSVVALESVVRPLTGQSQSSLVAVASTLLIAALFVPLRARVQAAIDRRFYRSRYSAARTLATFGIAVRDETDLQQLSEHLLRVVDQTMKPASVGLWLRSSADRRPGAKP
jgi:hypothetical protein